MLFFPPLADEEWMDLQIDPRDRMPRVKLSATPTTELSGFLNGCVSAVSRFEDARHVSGVYL